MCDFQVVQCACKFAAQTVCIHRHKMCWQCWSTQACSQKEEQFEVSKLYSKDEVCFVQSSCWHLRWDGLLGVLKLVFGGVQFL